MSSYETEPIFLRLVALREAYKIVTVGESCLLHTFYRCEDPDGVDSLKEDDGCEKSESESDDESNDGKQGKLPHSKCIYCF